jgi:hypothetical protein
MTEIISPILFTKTPPLFSKINHYQKKYFLIQILVQMFNVFVLLYFIKTSESRLLEVLYLKSKNKIQVPKCLTQVPNCPGAEVSSIHAIQASHWQTWIWAPVWDISALVFYSLILGTKLPIALILMFWYLFSRFHKIYS